MSHRVACLVCGAAQPDMAAIACGVCGGPLGFSYDLAALPPPDPAARGMWRHRRLLPFTPDAVPVTLGEGGTPLLDSRLDGRVRLLWKDESRNPTGSHKDRALSVAATHARTIGATTVAVVSAGSTGLACAAYAARAGLPAVVLIPTGAPVERIYPVGVYGARMVEVAAGIDDVIDAARALAGVGGLYVASTERRSCPVQGEAAKTIAHEIVEQLGDAPDWMLVPVGGGATLAAIWRGFGECQALGLATRTPRLVGVVPAAYDALAAAFRAGIDAPAPYHALPYRDDVPTVLTKLSHAHPPDGLEALAAIRASGGTVVAIGDAAAMEGTRRIAAADGLYLEPSAGVLAPALDALLRDGIMAADATVVALACGSGFRETFVLAERTPPRIERVGVGELARLLA